MEYNTKDKTRFTTINGSIYSNNPEAVKSKVTTGNARWLLNHLYVELAKHDPEAAERICKYKNA